MSAVVMSEVQFQRKVSRGTAGPSQHGYEPQDADAMVQVRLAQGPAGLAAYVQRSADLRREPCWSQYFQALANRYGKDRMTSEALFILAPVSRVYPPAVVERAKTAARRLGAVF